MRVSSRQWAYETKLKVGVWTGGISFGLFTLQVVSKVMGMGGITQVGGQGKEEACKGNQES